jgi:hypothetical protein
MVANRFACDQQAIRLAAWENHRAELLRFALAEEIGPRALELFPDSP